MIASNSNKGVTMTGTKMSKSQGKGDKSWWEGTTTSRLGRTESEEYIVGGGGKVNVPLEVWETTVVEVERGSVRQYPGDPETSGSKMYDGAGGGNKTVVTAMSSPVPGRNSSGSRGSKD